MIKLMAAGAEKHDMGISPDGPRGPRERCQIGAVYLAKRRRLPVVPIGFSAKPSLVLSSWDRFMIPLPFAKCSVVYGEGAVYDECLSEESVEEARSDLERRLNHVMQKADNYCGRKIE
jgi:lysophospholipid acyltransferase (LPLAT)-like uncharacterized protein